jgi:photosystem II stability/assembly factor-like uncharacterized protein
MNFKKALLPVIIILVLCSGYIQVLAQSNPFHPPDHAQRTPFRDNMRHITVDNCCPDHQQYFIRPEYYTRFEQAENFIHINQPDLKELNRPSTGGWVSLGPEGGYINVLLMHPTDHNILYAQTYGNPAKIFKSTNGGKNWELISRLPIEIYSFALDPNNPSIMYGAYGYRIYKSSDGGSNWTDYQIDTNWLYEPYIQINPNNSQVIYIGGCTYADNKMTMIVYKSINGGMNWSSFEVRPINYNNGYAYCFTLNRSNPEVLYISGFYYDEYGNYYSALFKSTDGGVSWIDKSNGLEQPIYDIKIDPNNSEKIYACNYNNIYRSIDGGSNWQKNNDRAYAYKLAIDPQNTNVIYAGYNSNIFKSTDGGVNWSYYTYELKGQCQSLLIDPINSNNLYYSSPVGAFRSVNGGVYWSAENSGIVASTISSMALAPSDPQKIYIEFYYNAVFKSFNSGNSWNQLPEFTSCGYIGALAVNYTSPDIAFALEESG